MDGTLDTLNIELVGTTAKAKVSINDLITSLEHLDVKLGSIKNLETFKSSMSSLSESLDSVKKSVGEMDVSKFKQVSDSFNSISRASGKLATAVRSLTFTKVQNEAQGFTREIQRMSQTLASEFGIKDKAIIKDLENQLTEFAKMTNNAMFSGGSIAEGEKIFQNMTNTLYRNKNVVNDIGTQYEGLVNKIKAANVQLDFQKSEFTDMYAKMRNAMGKGWSLSSSNKGGMPFDAWLEALTPEDISLMQTYGYKIGDTVSAFQALYDIKKRYMDITKSGAVVENEVNSTMNGTRTAVTETMNAIMGLSQQLGQVSTIGQTEVVNTFQTMAEGIKNFEGVSLGSVDQIKTLSSAVATFGRGSTEKAITNIPLVAKAFKEMMHTLSTAPTVSRNVIDVANALANLSKSGLRANTTMNTLVPSFKRFGDSAKRASHSVRGLAGQFGKFYATFWLLLRVFRRLGDAIDLSSQLTEIENVINQTFGNMRGVIDNMTKDSITKFGMSELAVKKYGARFQAMGAALGITSEQVIATTSRLSFLPDEYGKLGTSMADVSTNLTRLTADMASFYDVAQDDVAEDLEAIFTGMTRPLRAYGIDLTQANLKEWALNRGLNANIDSMTQAEKTMLRYQYVMERAQYAMGDFTRTADTWHNQINILKANIQQLAIVIGQGFINALKPLVRGLNAMLVKITSFATAVLNALGQIFGWKYELNLGGITQDLDDGAGYAEDMSDGLGGAAKNAKKLKQNLLGIDELNIISPDDDGSGSGGGGGAAGGAGALDNTDVIRAVKTGEGLMKSYIDNLYKLGDYIGETLTKTLNGIDWDGVYEGARNFGYGLADFLNGLISPELFGAVGKTIANSLNTAITAALAFGKRFDAYNLGESIAAGVNEFFYNFDAKQFAEAINVWVQKIYLTIKTAIKKIDWSAVWDDAKDFLSEIDLETVTIVIGAIALKHGFKMLTAVSIKDLILGKIAKAGGITVALKGLTIKFLDIAAAGFSGVPLAEAIASSLGVSVAAVTIAGSAAFITLGLVVGWKLGKWLDEKGFFDALKKNLDDFREKIKKTFAESFGKTDEMMGWDGETVTLYTPFSSMVKSKGLFGAIGETFFNFDEAKKWFNKAKEDIGTNIVLGIADGIAGSVVALFEPLHDVFIFIIEGFKNLFGIHSPADATKPIGKFIILGIGEGFSLVNFVQMMQDWWDKNVAPWFTLERWSTIGENVRKGVSDKLQELRTSVDEKWDGIKNKLAEVPFVQTLSNNFMTLRETLSGRLRETRTNIYSAWDNIKAKLAETPFVTTLSNKFSTLKTTIDTNLASIKNDVVTKWDNVKAKLSETPFVSTVISAFSSLAGTVRSYMNSLWDSVRDYWDRIKDKLSQTISGNININTNNSSSRRADGGIFVNGHWKDVAAYASGGLPTTGQMFIAREAGPELVGSIGGHTAVMNNDQIVSSVAYGVRQAVAEVLVPYLANIAATNEEIAEKDMSVNIGDRDIAMANRRGSRGLGAELRTN